MSRFMHMLAGPLCSLAKAGCVKPILPAMMRLELAELRTSHQPLPTLSHIYVILSTVLWEWNDLEGALRYGRQAVDLARRWEQADVLHFAYENLGTVLFATGDVEEAFIVHHQAWQIAHRTSAWFEESTIAQEVEWYLAQDNLEAALQRLRLAQIDIEELTEYPSSNHISDNCL